MRTTLCLSTPLCSLTHAVAINWLVGGNGNNPELQQDKHFRFPPTDNFAFTLQWCGDTITSSSCFKYRRRQCLKWKQRSSMKPHKINSEPHCLFTFNSQQLASRIILTLEHWDFKWMRLGPMGGVSKTVCAEEAAEGATSSSGSCHHQISWQLNLLFSNYMAMCALTRFVWTLRPPSSCLQISTAANPSVTNGEASTTTALGHGIGVEEKDGGVGEVKIWWLG